LARALSDPDTPTEPETIPDLESFDSLSEGLRQGIQDLGWEKPMPVQARVIPMMERGNDLIAQARTGSGKTGAFGIPIIRAIDTELRQPQALIMEPTRELANQVHGEMTALGKHCGITSLPIYGGVGYGVQLDALEDGVHVISGTPGRMLDHLNSGRLSFEHIKILILDEADELLSLGFWPDMREIKSFLPDSRQSCLFSATMPEKVLALSRAFLNEPEFVSLVEGHSSPTEIEHFFCVTTAQEKERSLCRILEYEDPDSAIIFCNTKDDVRFVTAFLQRHGFDADQISGDLAQAARERAMARIKAGELRYLVATDVAARGIDISDLSHVISYAAPQSPEVYVHRTGRTGRAGKAGVAISLVSGLDIGNFRQVQKVNKITVKERKIPTDESIVDRLRERLLVKVEQEIRHLSPTDRALRVDRLIPVVEAMAASEDGRRDLAGICGAYLREHRPETTVTDVVEPSSDPAAEAPPQSRTGGGGRGGGRRRKGGGGGGGRSRRR